MSDAVPGGSAGGNDAVIHDVGYQRYVGDRSPQSTRHRVIVANVVAMAWRGWWRLKLWVIGAVVVTAVFGGIMYVGKLAGQVVRGGAPLSWADAAIPVSIGAYASLGFVVSMTVAAGMVANDLRAGAFEFYFARAVRPIDYVAGKVLGVAIVVGALLAAGPVVLTIVRLALTDDLGQAAAKLTLVPRALAMGLIATAAYTLPPLAISALSSKRTYTMAAWATFYMVIGSIMVGVARHTDRPALAALDVSAAVRGLASAIFDVQLRRQTYPPAWAAAASLGGMCAASLAVLYTRVARAERGGMGGG